MKLLTVLILITLIQSHVFAQSVRRPNVEKSTLELGAGAVFGKTPHYPGSNQHNEILFPFPVLIYRGDRLRADEDGGIRTRFLYSKKFELNLSFGGSLPVSSKKNTARQGMPKLQTLLELGPGFIFHFLDKYNSKKWKLSLNIPYRHVVSTNIKDTYFRGFVFNPILYSYYDFTENFSIFTSISGRWATQRYNDYLYSVDDQFTTNSRPRYEANSGHVLMSYGLALIYNYKDFTIFTGMSIDDASASANKNSPLFIKEQSYSTAIGFTYYFYKSDD
ncbi:hypothetical protein A9Q84_01030 [Halobacteriovorax marinus]|uniref:Outer membrane protein n=1 Tax=Halobacteriovorax marinus TaxID=97084 RepID=A0A1Y5FHF4_9BACT|nr:hypothetical protein A9Q84_01030 [Halobacteriovorax marinus]